MALDFLAGCLGGAAGVVVGYPFDTCKVHLQTQTPNVKPMGTLACLRSIIAKDSIKGPFRGMSSPLGGIAFINAIVFGVYGNIQRNSTDPNSLQSHFMAGCTAGLVQSFVCSPMELVKTKMQVQDNFKGALKCKSPWQCAQNIVRTHGLRGMCRGLGITALRDCPGFSCYFVSYELMTQRSTNPSTFHILMAGGLAGTFSWMLTFPIDVIKSRLQADGMDGPHKYSGITDCMKKSYQAEGLSFYTRGLAPTLYRAFYSNAACFIVVSWVMKLAEMFHLSIEIHKAEPIAIIGSSSTPISHPGYHLSHHHVTESPESQRKRSHVIKSLIFFGAFSEAVCHSEMIELGNSLYDDEYNYVKIGDDISPVLSDLHKDPFLFLN